VRGALVPDALAIEIVKERLRQPDCLRGFVLDGFPRTVHQAESLDVALQELDMRLDAAVNIQISEAEAIRRIANRRVCSQCGSTAGAEATGRCPECQGPLIQRPDDTPETARNRLVVYLAQTQPVVDYYRSRGCLVPVNGLQPIEKVQEQIVKRLTQMGVAMPTGYASEIAR
jgi:adenylate kinase